MIIGFTGTQQGMLPRQKQMFLQTLKIKHCDEFLHGDCIGADIQAADLAVDFGIVLFTVYPPLHDFKRAYWCDRNKYARQEIPWLDIKYRGKDIKVRWRNPKPFLERNKDLVKDCNLLIAAPKEDRHTVRSGTWATIRIAWKLKKDLIQLPPLEGDGLDTERKEGEE